jgi:hypothetical protein
MALCAAGSCTERAMVGGPSSLARRHANRQLRSGRTDHSPSARTPGRMTSTHTPGARLAHAGGSYDRRMRRTELAIGVT